MNNRLKKLVLFDIDGTLIWVNGAGKNALSMALMDIYSQKGILDHYDCSGKTDPQIIIESLRNTIADHTIRSKLDKTLKRYVKYLPEVMSRKIGRMKVLPGVTRLLEILVERDDVLVGLLTGNVEDGATVKLTTLGLDNYFRFGAYSSDSIHRDELPEIALDRAEKIAGKRFRGKDIVIIGDSIYDVRCGRSLGVKSIAVSTGLTSFESLSAENPDHILTDLSKTETVVRLIMG